MKIRSAAHRRYLWRFFPVMGLYVVVLLGVTWLFKHQPPQGPIRYVLAAAPAIPIIGLLAVLGLYLAEEKDEFERMVMAQAMLWAIGVTLAFSSIADCMTNYGLMGPPPMFANFCLFVFTWGMAQPFIRRRFR